MAKKSFYIGAILLIVILNYMAIYHRKSDFDYKKSALGLASIYFLDICILKIIYFLLGRKTKSLFLELLVAILLFIVFLFLRELYDEGYQMGFYSGFVFVIGYKIYFHKIGKNNVDDYPNIF